MNTCANPKCARPQHYLREGRIFIFEVPGEGAEDDARRLQRIEHRWLCGTCSQHLTMKLFVDGIRTVPREPAAEPAQPAPLTVTS